MAATLKMQEYAKAIAEKLQIDEPDFANFDETSFFINEHNSEYKRITSINNILEKLETEHGYFKNSFSKDFTDILVELYGKVGVYVFYAHDDVVYIGKSLNLQERIYTSLKQRILKEPITHLSLFLTKKEADAHILEVLLITENKPKLNRDCKCNDTSDRYHSGFDLKTMPKIQIFEEV